MANIGRELAEARTRAAMSLQELARRTKISLPTLQAIERNDMKSLPGGLYARGLLRAYAREVGCDPEDIVRRFRESLDGQQLERSETLDQISATRETARPEAVREAGRGPDVDTEAADRRRSRSQLLILTLALTLGGTLYVGYQHNLIPRSWPRSVEPATSPTTPPAAPSPQPVAEAPKPKSADAPAASAVATGGTQRADQTESSERAQATDRIPPTERVTDSVQPAPIRTQPLDPATLPQPATETLPANQAQPASQTQPVDQTQPPDQTQPADQAPDGKPMALRLDIQPKGECWLSGIADGQRVIYRLLSSGERMQISAREDLVLRVGDPAAFSFTINGAAGKSLGSPGEAVTIHLTPQNYRAFLSASQ